MSGSLVDFFFGKKVLERAAGKEEKKPAAPQNTSDLAKSVRESMSSNPEYRRAAEAAASKKPVSSGVRDVLMTGKKPR